MSNRNGSAQQDEPLIDFSGLFTDIRDAMDTAAKMLTAIGVAVTKIATKDRFSVLSGGTFEMPLQKGRNGTVRMIVNNTANIVTVQLLDPMETPLLGTAANPYSIAAGAAIPLWIPFKSGLRIIASGLVTVSGEITYF